jgi:hypothetical protein
MIFKTIVPRIGDKEQYIGKPFHNQKHEVIGSVVNCEEQGDGFELTIDAELEINQNKKISFSIQDK